MKMFCLIAGGMIVFTGSEYSCKRVQKKISLYAKTNIVPANNEEPNYEGAEIKVRENTIDPINRTIQRPGNTVTINAPKGWKPGMIFFKLDTHVASTYAPDVRPPGYTNINSMALTDEEGIKALFRKAKQFAKKEGT